jgi:hypothetical protein
VYWTLKWLLEGDCIVKHSDLKLTAVDCYRMAVMLIFSGHVVPLEDVDRLVTLAKLIPVPHLQERLAYDSYQELGTMMLNIHAKLATVVQYNDEELMNRLYMEVYARARPLDDFTTGVPALNTRKMLNTILLRQPQMLIAYDIDAIAGLLRRPDVTTEMAWEYIWRFVESGNYALLKKLDQWIMALPTDASGNELTARMIMKCRGRGADGAVKACFEAVLWTGNFCMSHETMLMLKMFEEYDWFIENCVDIKDDKLLSTYQLMQNYEFN